MGNTFLMGFKSWSHLGPLASEIQRLGLGWSVIPLTGEKATPDTVTDGACVWLGKAFCHPAQKGSGLGGEGGIGNILVTHFCS